MSSSIGRPTFDGTVVTARVFIANTEFVEHSNLITLIQSAWVSGQIRARLPDQEAFLVGISDMLPVVFQETLTTTSTVTQASTASTSSSASTSDTQTVDITEENEVDLSAACEQVECPGDTVCRLSTRLSDDCVPGFLLGCVECVTARVQTSVILPFLPLEGLREEEAQEDIQDVVQQRLNSFDDHLTYWYFNSFLVTYVWSGFKLRWWAPTTLSSCPWLLKIPRLKKILVYCATCSPLGTRICSISR